MCCESFPLSMVASIRVVLGVLSSWLFGASLFVLCVAAYDGI